MIMDNRFLKEITVYNDILSSKSKIHAWKSPADFPISSLKEEDIDKLKDIVAIDLSFNGSAQDKYAFDEMYQYVELVIASYFQKYEGKAYIFKSEHIVQPSNKVRSYKNKHRYKDINKDYYIQAEVTVENNYTLFADLIETNAENIKMLLKLFMDSDTGFIIHTKKQILDEYYLNLIVKEMMTHKGNSHLNYLNIISKFCLEGDIIYRMGGDITTIETDFQIFTLKDKKDLIIRCL